MCMHERFDGSHSLHGLYAHLITHLGIEFVYPGIRDILPYKSLGISVKCFKNLYK